MHGGWLIRGLLALADFHRRMLPVYFAVIGPRAAYTVTGTLGRLMYRVLPPLRQRSEAQCAAGLAGRVPAARVAKIAEQACVHRIWNLTDLLLADRRLHPGTCERCGGRVPEPHRSEILAAQRRGQPAILVSAYYGPYDLLPVFLGYSGIRAAAVYLAHPNPRFDALRNRVRARSGCELVPVERALQRLPAVLESGGSVAIIADHYAEKRGVPVTFLGRPTFVPRTVGLLACRYNADVVVAGIRRTGAFRFVIEVTDVCKHAEWAAATDPVVYITERYTRALEALVLRDPTQYLWLHARWGPAA
jgi:KDO2-lipid IV(A) lauroyltransferase